jgi:hypothetical protein
MKSIALSLVTLATLTFAGCGGGGGGGDAGSGDAKPTPAGTAPAKTAVPKDCESQWKEHVATAPIGQVVSYETTEVTAGTGDARLDGTVHTISRDVLTEATDEAVVKKTHIDYLEPHYGPLDGETRITKETFLLTCIPYDPDTIEPDPAGLAAAGIEVLEERTETTVVRAGTFQALYEKIHVKGDPNAGVVGSDVLGNHWTIEKGMITVKEDVLVTSSYDGVQSTKTTKRELIEYVPGTPKG